MLELHALGRHAEQGGEPALKADRHVAQTDGAMAVVEQRLGDEAGRVGEVEQPGAGRAEAPGVGGDVEHDGHGAQRLGEAARAGRLLSDAAEPQGDGLVAQARGHAADAQLDEHERGVARWPRPGRSWS